MAVQAAEALAVDAQGVAAGLATCRRWQGDLHRRETAAPAWRVSGRSTGGRPWGRRRSRSPPPEQFADHPQSCGPRPLPDAVGVDVPATSSRHLAHGLAVQAEQGGRLAVAAVAAQQGGEARRGAASRSTAEQRDGGRQRLLSGCPGTGSAGSASGPAAWIRRAAICVATGRVGRAVGERRCTRARAMWPSRASRARASMVRTPSNDFRPGSAGGGGVDQGAGGGAQGAAGGAAEPLWEQAGGVTGALAEGVEAPAVGELER